MDTRDDYCGLCDNGADCSVHGPVQSGDGVWLWIALGLLLALVLIVAVVLYAPLPIAIPTGLVASWLLWSR